MLWLIIYIDLFTNMMTYFFNLGLELIINRYFSLGMNKSTLLIKTIRILINNILERGSTFNGDRTIDEIKTLIIDLLLEF
jgi:hypothetical protein